MQQSHSPAPGQQVVIRDEAWTIVGIERFESVRLLTLRGLGPDNDGERRLLLAPFDRVRPAPAATRLRRTSRQNAIAAAAAAVAEARRWDDCWTAGAARIDLRGWQLAPAVAVLRGATRVLLADEVGMGKTIQAGLIIAELFARGVASRALVLTPASIRDQWAAELSARCGLDASVLDHERIAAALSVLPVGVNPWSTEPLIVSSIDLVKRPEVRAALDRVPFDVLVVDEAHHLTPATDRFAVASDLAARTPWLVLATATPPGEPDGGDRVVSPLRALGRITAGEGTGRCEDGDEMAVFRRSGRAALDGVSRREKQLRVRTTPDEQRLIDAADAYVHALRTSPAGGAGGGQEAAKLVASVIARRAASSAEAARRTLARRLALLTNTGIEPLHRAQDALPWADEDDDGAELAEEVLGRPGLTDLRTEITWLEKLVELASAASADASKIDAVARLLRRTTEPLLVFSEYRDVVLQAAERLQAVAPTAVLHGGLSPRERREAIAAFIGGRVRVLVATDAAGEGLNLQKRCRWVVTIELPWNPMRVEQRIGRVDRIGQTRRVHAIHLVHRGSYEAAIIWRHQRRRSWRPGAEAPPAHDDLLAAPALERRLGAASARRPVRASRGGVFAPRPPARGAARRLVLVFAATIADRSGRIVERHVIPVRIEIAPARAGREVPGDDARRLRRSLVRRLSAHPRVRACVDEVVQQRSEGASRTLSGFARAMERRMAAISQEVDRRRARTAWQGSLFDRRAEQRAVDTQAGLAAIADHVQRRADAARALQVVSGSTPRLVAAWIE